jgi:hypothetical protein
MPYSNLTNVRVIQKQQRRNLPLFMLSIYGSFHQEDSSEEKSDMWVAIYHVVFKKWIVSNDFEQCGLNEKAENVIVVGFADNIHSIMFVVYEHQLSLGMKRTIADEIKPKPMKVTAKNDEWTGWKGENPEFKRSSILSYMSENQSHLMRDIWGQSILDSFRPQDREDKDKHQE